MFKEFFNWTNINISSMLRHGSVGVITMFGIGLLFGEGNIMMAFPVALMSILLDKQNIHIKPFSKILRLIILNLIIVFTAYISSINFLIGVPINFIAIFLIMYTLVSPYDMTFYKPFIMLFVFTQYITVAIDEIPERFLSVIFGVLVVAFFSVLFNSNKEKRILSKNITTSLTLINNQLGNILVNSYDSGISDKCTRAMRDLAYRIYISRHKKYLLTYLGRIEFNIYLNIEHFNLYLKSLYHSFSEDNVTDIKEITFVVSNLLLYCNGELSLHDAEKSFRQIDIKEKPQKILHVLGIIDNIFYCFNQLEGLSKKQKNKIYKKWRRSDLDRFMPTFREYFKPNTIRFKFAMRTAITLTFALFVGEMLGLYKVIWAIITIMSIIQPYYEDTIKRTKDRIRGNIVAILFVGIVINIVNTRGFTIAILVFSVYMLYGYKEYHKISLFSSIASISLSSLGHNINELIFYRIVYVLFGVLIIIIANRVLFPYRIKDGISQLMIKIMRLNNILIKNSFGYVKGENNAHGIRDILLHITLLSQKLYLRNTQYNDDLVNKFININNRFTIEMGYKILREYKDEKGYFYKPTR